MLLSEVWRTVNPLRVDVDRVGEPVDAHRVLGAAAVAQDRAERVVDVHLAVARLGLAAEWAVEDLRDLRLRLLRRRLRALPLAHLFCKELMGREEKVSDWVWQIWRREDGECR